MLILWLKFRNEVKNFRPTFREHGKKWLFSKRWNVTFHRGGPPLWQQKAAFRKYESAALFIIHKPIGSVREHFRLGVRASDRHVHASIHSRMIASIKPWRHACVLAGSRVQKRDNDVQLQSVCLSEGKWGERVCYGGLPSTMLINYSWYDRF